jgi:hypothetical protein
VYLAGAVQGPNPACNTASVAGLMSIPKMGDITVAMNISSPDTAYTAIDSIVVKITPLALFGSTYLPASQSWYPDPDVGDLANAIEYYTLTETNALTWVFKNGDIPLNAKQYKVQVYRADAAAIASRDFVVKFTVINKVKL